ncbi:MULTISPECIES: hypothetical protein [Bacteroidales]|uniref:NVEALA family protein n=1 Tax=Parabacteroides distasonis TaxID=823 RepID=A0A3L7ZLW7_PARDI|nr:MULTISPECIES: hypothetical protein [Bacteroidales]NBH90429.1 hypothetical protein [Parabacteroides distasonis]RLT71962.1 hypothetical protein D7V78_18460 [Parabacteroides distasonis]
MLKKILTIGSFAAIAAAFGFNNTDSANEEVSVSDLISANTEALAYCPNGCVEGGSSCFCNGYEYPLKEYSGW